MTTSLTTASPTLHLPIRAGLIKPDTNDRQLELKLGAYMRKQHPPAFVNEHEAADVALMPASRYQDQGAWIQNVGPSLGLSREEIKELQRSPLPTLSPYVVKIKFYNVGIEAIDHFDWKAHIGGEADLVLLPEAPAFTGPDGCPRAHYRLVTHRHLVGDFCFIKATKFLPHSAPRL